MNVNNARSLGQLLARCLSFAPYRLALSLLLMLVNSVASGIGITLIIPLLGTLDVDLGASSSQVADVFNRLFNFFGVQPDLPSILIAYVILITLVAAIAYYNTVISSSLQQAFVVELRKKMSETLFYTQWRFLSQAHMPDFIRLITVQVQSVASCLHLLMRLASGLILITVYLAFSFFLSSKLTMLALFCGLILIAIIWPINKRIYDSGRVSLSTNRSLYRSTFENLASLKIIKSFAAEEGYLERMQQSSELMETQQVRLSKFSAFTRFVNTVGAAVIFSLLFYSAIKWLDISIANLLVTLFIFSRLVPHLSSIQNSIQNLMHKAPSYRDLLSGMMELEQWAEPKSNTSPLEFKDCITLESISYCYLNRTKPALQRLSATIKHNQTVAIVGPSGAGKSTLVDLISGLLLPSSGKISIDNVVITQDNQRAWRQSVAYVTQDVFLFHDTVRANLSWVNVNEKHPASEKEIWEALDLALASGFIKRLPEGLDTMIGDRGVKLSGGERQRLALARALLARPRLLILDEASSALDRENELQIRDALIQLHGKLTMVIIAHNETTIEHINHRIELEIIDYNDC